MTLFEQVKSKLKPVEVALHYHIPVSRGQMMLCPFHQERTPSLKLYDDHFYCFGCHTAGDVITLAAGLFQLRPHEAADKLAADFGIDVSRPSTPSKSPRTYSYMRLCQDTLTEYFYVLNRFHKELAPQNPGDFPDERYIKSCRELPYIEYLIDTMDSHPDAVLQDMKNYGLTQKLSHALNLLDKEVIIA